MSGSRETIDAEPIDLNGHVPGDDDRCVICGHRLHVRLTKMNAILRRRGGVNDGARVFSPCEGVPVD